MKDTVIFDTIYQLTDNEIEKLADTDIFEDENISNIELILYQLTQGKLFFNSLMEFTDLLTNEIGFVNAEEDGYDSYRLIKRIIEATKMLKKTTDKEIINLLENISRKVTNKI